MPAVEDKLDVEKAARDEESTRILDRLFASAYQRSSKMTTRILKNANEVTAELRARE